MLGKGNNKGTKGKGKSNMYTAGNRGGGGAKKLSDLVGSSTDEGS